MQKSDPSVVNRKLSGIVLVAGLGFLLSLLAGYSVRLWYLGQYQEFQEEWLRALSVELKVEIQGGGQALHALQSVVMSSDEVSREAFDAHASSSFLRFPSVKSFYWAPIDAKNDYLIKISSSIKAESLNGRSIRSFEGLSEWVEQAVRSKRMLMLPVSPLSQSNLFLGMLPVQDAGQRRGILFAEFDFSANFDRLVKGRESFMRAMRLNDVTEPNRKVPFYSYNWNNDIQSLLSQRFSVAGRVIEIEYSGPDGSDGGVAWGGVLALSLLVTALATVLIARQESEGERLADGTYEATKDLVQRNLLYRHYLGNASEAFLALDDHGIVLNANARARTLFAGEFEGCAGYPISKFLSEESYDKLFPEGGLDPTGLVQEVLMDGVSVEGRHFPLMGQLILAKDVPGARWLLICRDVSVRMQAEARLKESDHQFKQAFLLGSVPMALIDKGGGICDTNKAFQDFLHESADVLKRKTIKEFMHPICVDAFTDWLDLAEARKQDTLKIEQRLLNQRGYQLWVVASYTAVYDDLGTLENIVCQYHDFTERRYAEEELKRNQEKLASLVEVRTKEVEGTRENLIASINAADNAIMVFDNQDRLEFSSDLVLDFFPEAKEELKPGIAARRMIELMSIRTNEGSEQQEKHYQNFGKGKNGDARLMSDGRWIQTSRRKTPSGGTIVVLTDVTSYKEQEAKLEKRTVELMEALRAQQEVNEQEKLFISMVSHEFKTPLAIIDSAAQRMLRRLDKLEIHDIEKHLKRVRGAVERLMNLIASTLTQQRLETGKLQYVPQKTELGQLVEAVCKDHHDIGGTHVLKIDDQGGGVKVLVDPVLFELVLINLLTNAEKYSPDASEIRVETKVQGKRVALSVEDDGIGISKEDQKMVFNRFFRSPSVGEIKGSGIGLTIVQQVMEIHSGEVTLESDVDKGSRFTLLFPIAD